MNDQPLLEFADVVKYFPVKRGLLQITVGHVKAVDGISLSLYPGETLGLVGETGCGKSTLGRLAVKLLEPTRGAVRFEGRALDTLRGRGLREFRRSVQIVFQDPFSSLNPRMTAGAIIAEGLKTHRLANGKADLRRRVIQLLQRAGLDESHVNRYPHEFSGGQRQRIGIARALAVSPRLIICDEPVSALDVSVQAQIINLLKDLQRDFGLSYLFIAHDLSVVRHISDRVAVMYLGKIVEIARSDEIYEHPAHPYTQALLSAVPVPDPGAKMREKRILLEGDVPSPINPPSGCRFHTRCPFVMDICRQKEPEMRRVSDGHHAACFLVEE